MANEIEKKPIGEIKTTPKVDNEFVSKILQKTEEQKIIWERVSTGYRGHTPDRSIDIELSTASSLFGFTWRLFSAKRGGAEIIRLVNSTGDLLMLAGITESTLYQKISKLLEILEYARSKEVRDAITDLDKL
jgi:hypothetical protein